MRKPTMTPAEIEAQLPSRPIRVDGNNRQTVRKWLVANGFPTTFVYGLSMTELALAFNDPTGQGMAAVRRKFESIPAEDLEDEQQQAAASHPVQSSVPTMPTLPQGDSPDIVAAIQAIASQVVPRASGIDAEAVKAIIREELPSLIPVTRIQIVSDTGTRELPAQAAHPMLGKLVSALSAGLHVMLVGPAGSGKTMGAEQAFRVLEKQFRIEGAVSGEHKVTGYSDAHGVYHATPFRDAFEHGHGFVKDEIDADDPTALLAMNAAMANGYAAFPDQTTPVQKADGFQVVACANTFGRGADRQYVGRNQLDAATLDRFVVLNWEYDETLERALCPNENWTRRVQSIRRAVDAEKARVIVSLRASINGAKLLAAGWLQSDVEECVIWKGIDSELRRRILARVES